MQVTKKLKTMQATSKKDATKTAAKAKLAKKELGEFTTLTVKRTVSALAKRIAAKVEKQKGARVSQGAIVQQALKAFDKTLPARAAA